MAYRLILPPEVGPPVVDLLPSFFLDHGAPEVECLYGLVSIELARLRPSALSLMGGVLQVEQCG